MIVRLLAFWALFVVCASHAAAQSYDYDERGRLIRATYSDCSTIRYFYDASGNRAERIVLTGDGSCAGNQAPVAADDAITMAPGATALFDLLAAHGSGVADGDPDNDDIRILSVEQGNIPADGGELGVQLQDDRRQVQIIAPSTEGAYAFSYEIEDVFGLTDQAQVQLTVQIGGGDGGSPTNSPPVWTSGLTANVYENSTTSFYTAMVSDADGDQPVFAIDTSFGQGSLFQLVGANLSLRSAEDFESPSAPNGTYQVRLTADDGQNHYPLPSRTVTVTLLNVVEPGEGNSPPTPQPDTDTATKDILHWVNVLANDVDPDGDVLELVDDTGAVGSAGGSMIFDSPWLKVTSSVALGQSETFDYCVTDGQAEACSTLTVTIDNRRPVPSPSSYTVHVGETYTFDDILVGDTDPDGDPLAIGRVDNVSHIANGASAVLQADNQTVVYTAPNVAGSAQFGVVVDDGRGGYIFKWVNLTVLPAVPTAFNDAYSVTALQGQNLTVLANDLDHAGGGLEITSVTSDWEDCVDTGGPLDPIEFPPDGGGLCDLAPQLLIAANKQSVSFSAGFLPAGTQTGFSYTIRDINNNTASAYVAITITAPANSAPNAVNNSYTVASGSTMNFSVLGNDSDPDGDSLSLVSVSGVSGGGSVSRNGNQARFVAPTGPATSSFTYTISDGRGGTDSATVTVTTSAPANSAPNAVNNSYTVASGSTMNFSVLGNDSDPDGDSLSLVSVSGVSGSGSVSRNGNQARFVAPTGPATSSFSYTISDGRGGTDSATVTVTTSAPANRVPNAVNNSYTVASGSTTNFSVLSNDSDPDGDSLSLTSVSGVSGSGSVSRNGNQARFVAPTGPATSSFSYTISDGRGGTDSATVTVTTNAPANQPPTPGTVSKTGLTQGLEMWVGVPLSGIDPDGDTVTLQSVSGGNRGGSAQLHGSRGDVIRVWSSASKGQWEEFTYTVSDGVNPAVSATLRVRVDNYRPSVSGNSYMFFPGQTRTLTDILSNDSDPDGDPLSIDRVYSFSGGGSGSVVNGGQAVSYTAPSSPGSASFWLVVVDPTGGYAAQRVDITVSSPFDPPCDGGILCP
jgi:YD repeat-containing protein